MLGDAVQLVFYIKFRRNFFELNSLSTLGDVVSLY
jgi:hypothetical protein